jgi:tetratricopeptide (TPR) repeat protein/GT2 family glycosyltransferase
MDYPHRTILLDDGHREQVRELCEELGVHYITRDNNLHAKAGNLNHALDQTEGEFVAILDADHVPEPHFLSRMIGYFKDPKLGFVQSPHAFSNFDTFQGRVNYEKGRFWDEGELFYKVIQPGRNSCNSVVFAGSAALFRREALKEVGYIATETITEDMHTGIRMAARGWRSMFVSERLVAGQGATDVTTFHSQRLRWAEGNLSILAHDNPLTMRGLTWRQRLTFLASIIHWAGGLPRLAIYLTPILMLLTGVSPVKDFTPTLAVVFATYIGMMMLSLKRVYRGYMNYDMIEFFNMANFWTQIRATARALLYRKKSKFIVTNKSGGRQGSILPHVLPQIMLLSLCQFSLLFGWSRHLLFDQRMDWLGLGIATFLVLHHARYAIAYLRIAMTPSSQRASYRHRLNIPVSYKFTNAEGQAFEGVGVSTDLNELGMSFIAYEKLPTHELGEVTMLVCDDRLHARASIVNMGQPEVIDKAGHALYRYGVQFEESTPETIDAAARLAQRYAIAPWFSIFDRGRGGKHGMLGSKREVRRAAYKLPVKLETPDGVRFTCTRDLSIQALRCNLGAHLPAGTKLRGEIFGPLGTIEVNLVVGTSRDVTGPPHKLQEVVFEIRSFEAQGRSMLQSLLELQSKPTARRDLEIEHREKRQSVLRPLAAASLAGVLLAPVAVAVFQEVHGDDFLLLRSIENGTLDPAGLKGENLDRILADVLEKEHPEEQRLILLKEALGSEGRYAEQVHVCRILADSRPEDPNMGLALVAALSSAKRHEESAALSSRWLAKLEVSGDSDSILQFQLLAARNLLHSGDPLRALDTFRRIAAQFPGDDEVSREYAGVLIQNGLLDEARSICLTLPRDKATQRQLAAIHSARSDFQEAERLTRGLLREDPTDLQLLLDLAKLQVWQREFLGAVETYRALHVAEPMNLDYTLSLGEVLSWSAEVEEALALFGQLLDRGLEEDRLTRGFLDAILGAETPSASDSHRLRLLLERHLHERPLSHDLAGRLGLALAHSGAVNEAIQLLEDEVERAPQDRDLRTRLADALASAGDHRAAQQHYRVLLQDAKRSRK